MNKNGLSAHKEQKVQVIYDDQVVGDFAADIVVENQVILELKSIKDLHPAHEAQLNNYPMLARPATQRFQVHGSRFEEEETEK
ncbi:MAG: GxxExxY protein [Desulfovermiculus sp.]|nr:GxxExxY protein [Desulfovermiculus sp.]